MYMLGPLTLGIWCERLSAGKQRSIESEVVKHVNQIRNEGRGRKEGVFSPALRLTG